MLGVNIYLAVVKRDLTNITMDLVRVKYNEIILGQPEMIQKYLNAIVVKN